MWKASKIRLLYFNLYKIMLNLIIIQKIIEMRYLLIKYQICRSCVIKFKTHVLLYLAIVAFGDISFNF
jgi:hypothetical protein